MHNHLRQNMCPAHQNRSLANGPSHPRLDPEEIQMVDVSGVPGPLRPHNQLCLPTKRWTRVVACPAHLPPFHAHLAHQENWLHFTHLKEGPGARWFAQPSSLPSGPLPASNQPIAPPPLQRRAICH